jgi:hypothetical protein
MPRGTHILNLPFSSMLAPIPSVLEKQDVSVEMDSFPALLRVPSTEPARERYRGDAFDRQG